MLRLSDTALWRAGRRWAWAGGFGLLLSGTTTATAQDCAPLCAAPGGCDPICAAPCGDVCDPGCNAPAGCTPAYSALTQGATGCDSVLGGCDGCDGGCDGCGSDCCDLGEPFRLADCLDLSCLDLGGCCDAGCDTTCDADGNGVGGEDAGGPTIGGWVQFGYHDGSTGQFNNRPGQFANHQSWVYIEDEADGSDGWDLGYRGDFMYGLDADDTQAFGNPDNTFDFQSNPNNFFNRGDYGFAIPQLYAEAAYGDFSVIAGHFYTLLGYEVVTAPDNFFYSHAFTMYNAEAFTHTGVLTTYAASEDVTLYNGYTFGWDTGFEQFDRLNGGQGSNYLGGASMALTDALTVTYITTAGDLGKVGEGYSHSIVADWQINDSWNYVFQSDYFDVDNTSILADDFVGTPNETDFNSANTRFYGINQYLFYTINDCWALGGRAEWFNTGEGDIYNVTGGVNYRPTANLVIRPEYRYQFEGSDGSLVNFFDEDVAVDEGIFGIDAILTY